MFVYPVTFVILSFSLLLFFSSWVYSVLDVYLSCLPDTAVFFCCPVSVILFSVSLSMFFIFCLFPVWFSNVSFSNFPTLFSPVPTCLSEQSLSYAYNVSNVLLLIILGFSFCFLLRSLNFFTFASAFCSLCLPFVLELDPLSWHLTVKIQLTIIVNKYTANDS